ncbi:MAG: hypothetical protein O2952_05355, partial [Bacteroidetes bacterium]|nr:hypothetical protein [Bacteroidota bacterium]
YPFPNYKIKMIQKQGHYLSFEYSSCSYINSNRTNEIFEDTVAQARELKNITDLCNRCESRAVKYNEKME